MSSADELFKAIGYDYYGGHEKVGTIQYFSDKEVIYFFIHHKKYHCSALEITTELHCAIHQKMRELGWIE